MPSQDDTNKRSRIPENEAITLIYTDVNIIHAFSFKSLYFQQYCYTWIGHPRCIFWCLYAITVSQYKQYKSIMM